MALEQRFSVVLICWNGGQCSPIHDHGSGTRSWAKVLCGTIDMRKYRLNTYSGCFSTSEEVDVKQFKEGDCLMESEYTGMHKLGNASLVDAAVSLHVYSPPCQ